MEQIIDVLSWILLMSGCFFCFAGGVGLLRLPDFYTRMHAAGITDTLGTGLILSGLILQTGWDPTVVKIMMVAALIMLTSPAATYALANSALDHGVKPIIGKQKEVDHS